MQKSDPAPESFRSLITRGDLDALSEWIREQRPLRGTSAKGRRLKSALEIAVDTGFYSMVRLLLEKAFWGEEELENALSSALWNKRSDIVHLLFRHGAPLESISFYTVFQTMDASLMSFFLEQGLDPCKNNAFADILDETKARPMLRFFKEHKEKYPVLEEQIAIALINAIQRKHVRWSILLIWAGADLNRPVPASLRSDPSSTPEWTTTAMEEIVSMGDLKFMEALKIQPTSQILGEVLRQAAFQLEKPEFRSRLKRMTPEELNSGKNGGCDALDYLVSKDTFHWRSYRPESEIHEEEERSLQAIDALLQAGAKWAPEESDFRSTRKGLMEHNAKHVVKVIRLLLYTPGAALAKDIWELCRTDKVRLAIQSVDRPLWDEILELAGNAEDGKGATNHSRGKRKGDDLSAASGVLPKN